MWRKKCYPNDLFYCILRYLQGHFCQWYALKISVINYGPWNLEERLLRVWFWKMLTWGHISRHPLLCLLLNQILRKIGFMQKVGQVCYYLCCFWWQISYLTALKSHPQVRGKTEVFCGCFLSFWWSQLDTNFCRCSIILLCMLGQK